MFLPWGVVQFRRKLALIVDHLPHQCQVGHRAVDTPCTIQLLEAGEHRSDGAMFSSHDGECTVRVGLLVIRLDAGHMYGKVGDLQQPMGHAAVQSTPKAWHAAVRTDEMQIAGMPVCRIEDGLGRMVASARIRRAFCVFQLI